MWKYCRPHSHFIDWVKRHILCGSGSFLSLTFTGDLTNFIFLSEFNLQPLTNAFAFNPLDHLDLPGSKAPIGRFANLSEAEETKNCRYYIDV